MRRGELSIITVKPTVQKQATEDKKDTNAATVGADGASLKLPEDSVVVYEVELISFITKMEIGEELQKWLLVEGDGWDVPRFASTCRGLFLAFFFFSFFFVRTPILVEDKFVNDNFVND